MGRVFEWWGRQWLPRERRDRERTARAYQMYMENFRAKVVREIVQRATRREEETLEKLRRQFEEEWEWRARVGSAAVDRWRAVQVQKKKNRVRRIDEDSANGDFVMGVEGIESSFAPRARPRRQSGARSYNASPYDSQRCARHSDATRERGEIFATAPD